MYTGGDNQELARALFGEPQHHSVTPINVMDVGRELKINVTIKFLALIGVQNENTFSALPLVVRVAAPTKAQSTVNKNAPPQLTSTT